MKLKYLIICIIPFIFSCSNNKESEYLKDHFAKNFLIGAAVNSNQFLENDTLSLRIIKNEFNTITPENVMKWEVIHPAPDSFDFSLADKYVAFGRKNKMFIVGHTLVWHNQTPKWVFYHKDGTLLTREELIARMRNHIQTVVGRYKGKINAWDVVNEAFNDDGTLRQSLWQKIIGNDFMEIAFQFAKAADSSAELYYNDYNMFLPGKVDATIRLVRALENKNIVVDGIGLQAHWGITSPSITDVEKALSTYSNANINVMLTEFDISVLPNPWEYQGAEIGVEFENLPEANPYTKSFPDSVSNLLATRYKDIFSLIQKYSNNVKRITFWGVNDGTSWKNNWPIKGRTDYPLLFDRNGHRKKAYFAILNIKNGAN